MTVIRGPEVGIDYIHIHKGNLLPSCSKVEGNIQGQICFSAAIMTADKGKGLEIHCFSP